MTSTRTSRSRALTVVLLLVACLGLAACETPQPTITWYGNETSVDSEPRLFCELTDQVEPVCPQTDGPTAKLTLHADDPVQVNLGNDVADKPWLLVYSYVDEPTSYRSPLITDGETLSYVIRPLPGKQLKQVDLQILTLTADANGQPQYSLLQDWVLEVEPA